MLIYFWGVSFLEVFYHLVIFLWNFMYPLVWHGLIFVGLFFAIISIVGMPHWWTNQWCLLCSPPWNNENRKYELFYWNALAKRQKHQWINWAVDGACSVLPHEIRQQRGAFCLDSDVVRTRHVPMWKLFKFKHYVGTGKVRVDSWLVIEGSKCVTLLLYSATGL